MPKVQTCTLKPSGKPGTPKPGLYYILPGLGPALCISTTGGRFDVVGAGLASHTLSIPSEPLQGYTLAPAEVGR